MKKISQLFLQGLFAILPIALTLLILFWLGGIAESTLGQIIRWVLPDSWYWPGMGIVTGFAFIVAVGVLLNAYIFQRLADIFDDIVKRIPLVKMIYNSIRDISKFASISQNGGKDSELQKAVLVDINEDSQIIGFITSDSPPVDGDKDCIAVYLPMGYQIGGFTVIVPKSSVKKLDISVQDAMRFVLTAGITKNE